MTPRGALTLATTQNAATARAAAPVVPLDKGRFTFLVHEHSTLALQVMKVMAERLRRANTRADNAPR